MSKLVKLVFHVLVWALCLANYDEINYFMMSILELNDTYAETTDNSTIQVCNDTEHLQVSDEMEWNPHTGNTIPFNASTLGPLIDSVTFNGIEGPSVPLPTTNQHDKTEVNPPTQGTTTSTENHSPPNSFDKKPHFGSAHPPNEGEVLAPTEGTTTTFRPNTRPCLTEDEPVCAREINITWLSIPPFIFQNANINDKETKTTDDLLPTGVFHSVIGRSIQFCCKATTLTGAGTRLRYVYKALNRSSFHRHIFYGDASVGIPVFINDEFMFFEYGVRLGFVKVLESPGLVLIANKNRLTQEGKQLFWKALSHEWPVVVISLLSCAISGIFVWALDTTSNAEEFPRRFHRGAFEGFWWAFVTMSTVGYGDKAPRSVIARLFCIVWIIMGLTVCSIMTATLTTALTTVSVNRHVNVVGQKIAVLKGSPAFQEVIRQGGNPVEFDKFGAMQNSLLDERNIVGIMEEMYTGLYYMKQASDSRLYVNRVFGRTRSYGFAFKNNDIIPLNVEDCLRNLIAHRMEDVYTLMKEYMDQLQRSIGGSNEQEEVVVLDAQSTTFYSTVSALVICLGALIATVFFCELAVMAYKKFMTGGNSPKDIESSVDRDRRDEELNIGQNATRVETRKEP